MADIEFEMTNAGRRIRLTLTCAVLVTVVVLMGALSYSGGSSEEIVAGSSLIQDILGDLTEGRCQAHGLVPPGMCPSHYDLRPSDLEAVVQSKVLIIHPWQQHMGNVEGIIEAAGLPGDRVKVVGVEGNWMVPSVHVEAVQAVGRILGEFESTGEIAYAHKVAEITESILSHGVRVKSRLQQAGLAGVKVLCGEKQAQFVQWAGLEVVAAYGRPEELSVADLDRLIRQGRDAGVALVVDNLQSGDAKAGRTLAGGTGAVQVVLSNFPGGFKGTGTWAKAVDKNADLLLAGFVRWRQDHE